MVLFLFYFFMETKFPLRIQTKPRRGRIFLNLSVGSLGLPLLRWVFIPIAVFIADWNTENEFGLMYILPLRSEVEFILSFLLIDYGVYLWHVMNHYVPFLWRFHNVHHIDQDLDVSTSVRFHFGELLIGIIVRGLVILLTGASAHVVLVYEIAFETANNFHHSNWRLPKVLESILNLFIVTPRMHGIHHSIVRKETDSNFSVVFSFWDRIHKTLKANIQQTEIIIGVPSYVDGKEQKFTKLIFLPFKKQRDWKLPDGSVPIRKG